MQKSAVNTALSTLSIPLPAFHTSMAYSRPGNRKCACTSVRVRACVHVRARTSHAPHALPRTGQCACHCLTTQPKPSYSQNLFCWLLIVVLSTCVDYHIILVERRCPAIRYRSRDIVWQEWRFTYHNYYHCVSIHPVHRAFLSSGEPWYSQKQFIPLVHSW